MKRFGLKLGLAIAAGVAVTGVIVAGAYGYLRTDRGSIAAGVRVGPVAIGGLSSPVARTRLGDWARALSEPIVIRAGRRHVRLAVRPAEPSVDVRDLIERALAATRSGSIFTRAARGLLGGRVNVDVDPRIAYRKGGLAGLVRRAEAALDRPVRDASVRPSARGLAVIRPRAGLSVDPGSLLRTITNAVAATGAARAVIVPLRRLRPRLGVAQLRRRYPAFITVDRARFTLRVYQRLRLRRSYPIAVGQIGLQTPAGVYHIQNKTTNPSWDVPRSAWAGSLAGQVIPPGPQDPLKARWLGIFNGAGIHGTDETWSIGHSLSHGCIRMTIPDVIDLYNRVPVGSPIFIGD